MWEYRQAPGWSLEPLAYAESSLIYRVNGSNAKPMAPTYRDGLGVAEHHREEVRMRVDRLLLHQGRGLRTSVQGYLAHKKPPPPRNLQGLMVVLGRGGVFL